MDSLRAARARVTLADFEERQIRRQKAKRAGRRLVWTMIVQYVVLIAAFIWVIREHLWQESPAISAVLASYLAADIFRQYATQSELAELRKKIERLEGRQ